MKPISASDVLRKSAPRETLGQTFLHVNRYEHLRESSPAPSLRMRSDSNASQKRKVSEDCYVDEIANRPKVSRLDTESAEEIAILDSKISKVSTLCGKMYTVVQQQQLEIDDPLRSLLADIIESIKVTNEVQSELSSKYRKIRAEQDSVPVQEVTYSSIAATGGRSAGLPPGEKGGGGKYNPRKKLSGGLVHSQASERGIMESKNTKVQETEEEKKVRKFNEAIRDAERSTLVFNLNMGNVPLMNKTTISEKASLALTKMAAAAEGKNRPIPSPDAVAAIDDLTSMVTNMEFYGNSTKEYKGKDSTGFCTVPVRYQFKDRDQKAFAEKTLRDTCKVKCTTPYPAVVRECIKQVVAHVRQSHPGDFVKVSVVPKEFSLKVSRRPPGKDLKWYDYPDLLRLPEEAWNVNLRKAPEGISMFYLPSEEMSSPPPRKERPPSPSKNRRGSTGEK
jgi:hypothetical protein